MQSCLGLRIPKSASLVCGKENHRRLLMYDSEMYVMRNHDNEIHGAVWLYLVSPVAISRHWLD
jgi:hypothetical protein